MAIARITRSMSTNPSAPGVDYQALVAAGRPMPEFLELGADADFSFDLPGAASFRSRISPYELNTEGKSYTLIDGSAGKYVVLSAGQNGMVGPTPDGRERTIGGLYLYRNAEPSTAIQAIAGTLTDNAGDGGEGVYIAADGAITLAVRGYTGSLASVNLGGLTAQNFPAVNTSMFVFVAVTSRLTGGPDNETEHTLFVGAPTPFSVSRSGVKVIGNRNIAFGNAYRTASAYNAMPGRFGRFFSCRRPYTIKDLNESYQIAKVIGARRGITVF